MWSLKVPLKKAQAVKAWLVEKGLFDKSRALLREKDFVYIPVTSFSKALVERFSFAKLSRKKLRPVLKQKSFKEQLKSALSKEEFKHLKTAFDVIGDIAIIEVDPELKRREKTIAQALLSLHKNIRTVLKKGSKHTGVFRTQKLVYLAGENKKETVHKENGVVLKLDVEKVYFSPRLSTERKRIASLVKQGENVLVMFSGCGPYVAVISKNSLAKKVFGVEINPTAHSYAVENMKLNKLTNTELFLGDARAVVPKLSKRERFDRIVMPLPKGAEDFLGTALQASKKGTVIHFYDFAREEEIPETSVRKIDKACRAAGKKYAVLNAVVCGQHSPRFFRVCVDFKLV